MAIKDLTGKTFGRWSVIKDSGNRTSSGNILWLCSCTCNTIKEVRGGSLTSGRSNSCGCHNRERVVQNHVTHGMKKHELYDTWSNMMARCYNKEHRQYKDYGGRGVYVDATWHDINVFITDMHPRIKNTSLDRINNDGIYCKENCKWSTIIQQNNNKRNNVVLEYKGITKTMCEWAAEVGVSKQALFYRIKAGWSIEEALTTPVGQKRKAA